MSCLQAILLEEPTPFLGNWYELEPNEYSFDPDQSGEVKLNFC